MGFWYTINLKVSSPGSVRQILHICFLHTRRLSMQYKHLRLVLNSNLSKSWLSTKSIWLSKLLWKFCTERDSFHSVLRAEFQNNRATKQCVMGKSYFARFRLKMRFGAIIYWKSFYARVGFHGISSSSCIYVHVAVVCSFPLGGSSTFVVVRHTYMVHVIQIRALWVCRGLIRHQQPWHCLCTMNSMGFFY